MKIIHSGAYRIDIGPHVFPTVKYDAIRAALLAGGVATREDLVTPEAASWEDLALVHTADYLDKVRRGCLSQDEIARLEMPWSESMVEGFRLMAGGTVLCARLALAEQAAPAAGRPRLRAAGHLGGGFHHACADHGEGFCLFNDVALAARVLLASREVQRVAVVDADVHQGNGTAAILGSDPAVFTYSLHQENNYPAVKPAGTLDQGLDDRAGDQEYLEALGDALPRVLGFDPDLLLYVAGADPYRGRPARRSRPHPLRFAAARSHGPGVGAGRGRSYGHRAGGRVRSPAGGHDRDPRRDHRGSGAAELAACLPGSSRRRTGSAVWPDAHARPAGVFNNAQTVSGATDTLLHKNVPVQQAAPRQWACDSPQARVEF